MQARITSVVFNMSGASIEDQISLILTQGGSALQDLWRSNSGHQGGGGDVVCCFGIGLQANVPAVSVIDPVTGLLSYWSQDVSTAPLPDIWIEGEVLVSFVSTDAGVITMLVMTYELRRKKIDR
jgi:hypothetical protein